jgi:hypothetical protein
VAEHSPEWRILAKLFLADRRAGGGDAERLEAFFASLEPEEAAHPLVRWIARKRACLDWTENLCDMVSAYFGLPPKPLYPGEQPPGYEEAAAALQRRLEAEGL